MTLDELDRSLPNGFHDAEIRSLELDYAAGIAKLRMTLLTGWPEDPDPERQAYQQATMTITGLCFCSIDPPDPSYPFHPNGKPICVSGDPAKPDHLPSLSNLSPRFPQGTWCYRFFVHDWNAFIHIAARDAEVTWIGATPKHATTPWKPVDKTTFERILKEEIASLTPQGARIYEIYSIPPYEQRCLRAADSRIEHVFVVARNGIRLLFFDDVEEEFGVGVPGGDSILRDLSTSGPLIAALLTLERTESIP